MHCVVQPSSLPSSGTLHRPRGSCTHSTVTSHPSSPGPWLPPVSLLSLEWTGLDVLHKMESHSMFLFVSDFLHSVMFSRFIPVLEQVPVPFTQASASSGLGPTLCLVFRFENAFIYRGPLWPALFFPLFPSSDSTEP